MKHQIQYKKIRAFTLVELLIVVVIVAILVTVSIMSINNARTKIIETNNSISI